MQEKETSISSKILKTNQNPSHKVLLPVHSPGQFIKQDHNNL
ncbi:hypothetical protein BSM4216_1759 [Bacillus smithii]|nr:hypothetical protein BSM4216_1759 [Bacillus smithii]